MGLYWRITTMWTSLHLRQSLYIHDIIGPIIYQCLIYMYLCYHTGCPGGPGNPCGPSGPGSPLITKKQTYYVRFVGGEIFHCKWQLHDNYYNNIPTCNKISFLFLLFYLCSFLPFLAVFTRGTLQRMSKSRHLIGTFNVKTSLDIAH